MKVFSVIFNGQEKAWQADKTTKIAIDNNQATITYKHPDYGKLQTVIDLTKAEMYTFG